LVGVEGVCSACGYLTETDICLVYYKLLYSMQRCIITAVCGVLKVDVEDQSSLGPKLVLEVLIFNN
jgi:hypothetical protein